MTESLVGGALNEIETLDPTVKLLIFLLLFLHNLRAPMKSGCSDDSSSYFSTFKLSCFCRKMLKHEENIMKKPTGVDCFRCSPQPAILTGASKRKEERTENRSRQRIHSRSRQEGGEEKGEKKKKKKKKKNKERKEGMKEGKRERHIYIYICYLCLLYISSKIIEFELSYCYYQTGLWIIK